MQVVRAGIESPLMKRARVSSSMLCALALQSTDPHSTVAPQANIGLIGHRSAAMPKGMLARAKPKMSVETVAETDGKSEPK